MLACSWPTPQIAAVGVVSALLTGCWAEPPAPACVSLEPESTAGGVGIPTLPIVVAGVQRKMLLDTGWPGMAFFNSRMTELPEDSRPAKVRGGWTEYKMIPLQPVTYSIAGRQAVHRWPERFPVDMPVFTERGIDGIAGVGAVAYAGSTLTHEASGRVCIAGNSCKKAPKLWTSITVGVDTREAFVDSGTPWTGALTPDFPELDVTVQGISGPLPLKPRDGRKGATIDGRPVDFVIGWDVLGSTTWRWDICAGTITFSGGDPG